MLDRPLRYHLLDVFTDTPFAGNPLAVFVDPPALTADQMGRIACELNLSETVFVDPPTAAGGAWPTRIFTPTVELPFAGHPTVGTAVLLAQLGLVDDEVVLAEGVGPVTVRLHAGSAGATFRAAQLPSPVTVAGPDELAAALSLTTGDLHADHPTSGWSCGVPYIVVPVRDVATLGRIRIDTGAWSRVAATTEADGVYPMAPTDDEHRWRARMFVPSFGIAEDPATGSAAAASAGFLAATTSAEDVVEWAIEQGVEMGRPGRIEVAVTIEAGAITAVDVGGRAVVVGSGTLSVPPT